MEQVKKNIKTCVVGDIEFKIAVNREMVAGAFEAFPKYWDFLMKASKNADKEIDSKMMLQLLKEQDKMQTMQEDFVLYLFPKMLAEAEQPLFDCENYDKQVDYFVQYFRDNDVWDDYEDEFGDIVAGVCRRLNEFAMSVFTTSKGTKKGKVHLAM